MLFNIALFLMFRQINIRICHLSSLIMYPLIHYVTPLNISGNSYYIVPLKTIFDIFLFLYNWILIEVEIIFTFCIISFDEWIKCCFVLWVRISQIIAGHVFFFFLIYSNIILQWLFPAIIIWCCIRNWHIPILITLTLVSILWLTNISHL